MNKRNVWLDENGEENVCEHGDHPAPIGKRFCSLWCEVCEHESNNGCDNFCKKLKNGRIRRIKQ